MISVKTEFTWNVTGQRIFDKAKSMIKEDACMTIYDNTKPLYLETDAPGMGLGLANYKQEVAQAVIEMWHQTTTYSDPSHL